MSLPEKVAISTSKLTAIGDAIRSRFGVSGELTLDEMATDISSSPIPIPPLVPSEYQQVDYVEGNGYVALDTGVKLNGRNYARIKFSMLGQKQSSGWDSVLGCDASGKKIQLSYNNNNNQVYFSYGNTTGSSFIISPTAIYDLIMLNCQVQISNNENTNIYSNGEVKNFTEQSRNFAVLGAGRDNETVGSITKGRIAYVELGNSIDDITYIGIPVYRKSDGVAGIYEPLTQTFNIGTGTSNFTCYPAPN